MNKIEDLHKIFSNSTGVSTDTRQTQSGKLFFALKGDNFDGNEYAEVALSKGAIGAVVDRKQLLGTPGCYYVKNTLATLQRLAYFHRRTFDIPVVGITGSNGKTTTKELIAAVLSQHYVVCSTQGNFNNHIGVPLTLLGITKDTEVAIIEMGANHPGEIGWLCHIASPNLGLVTNVGRAHLEGFGSLENIWNTKMGLYRYLDKKGGTVLINKEEPSLSPLEKVEFGKVFRFDRHSLPKPLQSVEFDLRSDTILVNLQSTSDSCDSEVQLYGQHNLNNLLSAIVVGATLDVPVSKICMGLSSFRSTQNRSQIIKEGTNVFYLDAYNANPTSMQMAIQFFANKEAGRKIAILGDMFELGDEAQELHQEIVNLIEEMDFEELILVGQTFSKCIVNESKCRFRKFITTAEAKTYLSESNYEHTHFLIKGSRSMKLETIII